MDESQRAEFARQAEADARNHKQYCPNCSGESPTGGYCSSCLAIMTAVERGPDITTWLQEDSFTTFLADDAFTGAIADDAYNAAQDDMLSATETGVDHSGPVDETGGRLTWNPDDHHIHPRQFEDEFANAGIDIHERTISLYQFQHQIVHSEGWNADWDMFFEVARQSGVQPTAQDVLEYGDYLIEKYELKHAVVHRYGDQSGDLGPHMT